MVSSSGSDSSSSNPTFFARLNNCQGCQQRKEYLQTMLTDSRFWVGIVVGAGGFWAFQKFVKRT